MPDWKKNNYTISTDKSRIDVEVVHDFLTHSYWAEGITRDVIVRSVENSLCFGLYNDDRLVGFARVISDLATFAYLADVFVVPAERGKGLSTWMLEVIFALPDLQGLRRFMLATRDAHALYARFGFTPVDRPDRWMQKHNANIYKVRPVVK